MYLRSDCDDAFTQISCVTDPRNGLEANDLEPGTYALFLDAHSDAINLSVAPTMNVRVIPRRTECNDGLDNDDDGLIDLYDAGCTNGRDTTETIPPGVPLPHPKSARIPSGAHSLPRQFCNKTPGAYGYKR